MHELIQLLAATTGSFGFAVVFNIRGRKLIFAMLGGTLCWTVYLAVSGFTSNPYLCAFCASVMITLYAECMARVHKTPVTVFLVSSAIPLFPGAILYRTMFYLVNRNWDAFVQESTYALLFAASIAAGITTTTVIFQARSAR